MTADLEVALQTAEASLRERAQLRRRLQEVEDQRARSDRELDQLHEVAVARAEAVERGEHVSIARVVSALRGSEPSLEQQRADLEAVHLKISEASARRGVLDRELEEARARLADLDGLDERYAELLAEKSRWAVAAGDAGAGERLAVASRSILITAEQGRIRDRLDALTEAHRAVEALLQALEHVQDASYWDVALAPVPGIGGGKYKRLDDAIQAGARANAALRQLAGLVRGRFDVGHIIDRIDVDGHTRFMDVWLDSPWADRDVSNRVREAHHRTGIVLARLSDAARTLMSRGEELEQEAKALEARRRDLPA